MQPAHLRLVELLAVIVEDEVEALAQCHHHEQRIVAGLDQPRPADREAGVLLLQRLIDGIVLEHQDGVEQRPAGTTGQTLHLVERRPVMLAQAQVAVLQVAQPRSHLHVWQGAVHHRQRIDEQPDDILGARKLRRTARDRRPEAHHRLARMLPQQLRPRALHQRVQRHPLTPRKCLQPLRQTGIQRQRQRSVPQLFRIQVFRIRPRRTAQRIRQEARLRQRAQRTAPERLRRRAVPPRKPGDVIAIATLHRRQRLPALMAQDLADQTRRAPAIMQDVVMRPDQPVTIVPQPDQAQALQRRA